MRPALHPQVPSTEMFPAFLRKIVVSAFAVIASYINENSRRTKFNLFFYDFNCDNNVNADFSSTRNKLKFKSPMINGQQPILPINYILKKL